MSTFITRLIKHTFFLFVLIIFTLAISGCPPVIDEKPPEEQSRYKIPVSIQFLNADSESTEEPQTVTIEIHDSRNLVFTPIGNQSSSYTVESGFLSLVVMGKEKPIDLSYRFTIRAYCEGFLPKTQTLVIDNYQNIYTPVFMMPLNDMPEGSNFVQAKANLSSGAIIQDNLQIKTQPSSSNSSNALATSLTIDSGTQLLGEAKTPISDSSKQVTIDLFQFDPGFEAPVLSFPNGFMVTDAIDRSGETLATLDNRFFFASLGYLDLKMKVGEQKVTGFSKPVSIEMEVSKDLTNPLTGKPYEQDNVVPVWSLNDSTGQWTSEENVILFEREGKLYTKFEMSHLSTWNLDQKIDACPAPPASPITINIDNTGQAFKARYADFHRSTPTLQIFNPTNANNVILIESNSIHTLEVINAPDIPSIGTGLQFNLYNSVRNTSGVASTIDNIGCGDIETLDLSGVPSDCAHFEIYIQCSDFMDNCFRPNIVGLWYQQGIPTVPGDIEYQTLHYAGVPVNGSIDIDMTEIKNTVGTSTSNYRFLLQFNSTSTSVTKTVMFDLRYDGTDPLNPKWDNLGLDATVSTFNTLTPPTPTSTNCALWYEILLVPTSAEGECGFDPNILYPGGC